MAGRKYAFADVWHVFDVFSVPCSAKTDAAARGVTIRVRCMHANQFNYPVKANFNIEIKKVCAHRNVWVPAETFGRG